MFENADSELRPEAISDIKNEKTVFSILQSKRKKIIRFVTPSVMDTQSAVFLTKINSFLFLVLLIIHIYREKLIFKLKNIPCRI